ncbi:MAG: glycosyltransferase family 9 protein, partial [Gammaproteobacteria bacterium]|nr:glycosyltransferase family 9 protein [Gammaproteobacteria bacterium]
MLSQSPPESICIVRLSAIGDTCHALAAVRAIQDVWPETRITWIIGKTEAALLGDIPDIEFIIFDKSRGKDARVEIRKKLAARTFDVALCMHASMRTNLFARAIRSPIRLGYDFARARDFQWLFTNQRIPAIRGQHVLDAMAEFTRAIGVSGQKLRWDIPLGSAHRDFATQYRRNGRPLMVISPCSSQRARNFRNWSAENYAAAANYARNKFSCDVVLTGGNSELEEEYGLTISRLCAQRVVNLMGKTNLKQLLALIAEADLLLCPDSGPAHMATAVGTPVIGLYATSNPERTGPYLNRDLIVNAYPEACQRFLGKSVDQLRWGQRIRDADAMGLIRLGKVNERIKQVFERNR